MSKKIKIAMDYCADPIWVYSGGIWLNEDLSDYEDYFSPELLSLLTKYRDLWEALSSGDKYLDRETPSSYQNIFDSTGEYITSLQKTCANLCKKEQPNFTVIFPKYEKGKYKEIEIKIR
ncbi:MAG: hypothetical protein [Caudoviricetes sp.]|nr:MAG: hypothetical protein [Caudoviricetes sp.]